MTVKKPEELKQVTDSVLCGLTATEELKSRIVYAAARQKIGESKNGDSKEKKSSGLLRFVPALCCCLALIICVSVLLPKMKSVTVDGQNILPAITDMPAGNMNPDSVNDLRTGTALSAEGRKVTSDADLPGIFSDRIPGQDEVTDSLASEPQIVSLEGRFYRLLNGVFGAEQLNPSSSLGVLTECETLSALTEGVKNGSTFLNPGTEILALDGMNGAFVAARYGQEMCVFQRVSVDRHGLLNGENIQDVLPDASHVVSVQYGDHETITNGEDVRALLALLPENAIHESPNALNSGEYLTLNLDNGLQFQFTVNQQRISFCGTWLCPEFMEKLESLL